MPNLFIRLLACYLSPYVNQVIKAKLLQQAGVSGVNFELTKSLYQSNSVSYSFRIGRIGCIIIFIFSSIVFSMYECKSTLYKVVFEIYGTSRFAFTLIFLDTLSRGTHMLAYSLI